MSRKKLRQLEAQRADQWTVARDEALACFTAGRYEEGEGVIRALDSDIEGGIAIEQCYLRHLEDLVSRDADAARLRLIFDRGVGWAMGNVPTPHTAMEAERNALAAAEGRARFVHVLGRDPA